MCRPTEKATLPVAKYDAQELKKLVKKIAPVSLSVQGIRPGCFGILSLHADFHGDTTGHCYCHSATLLEGLHAALGHPMCNYPSHTVGKPFVPDLCTQEDSSWLTCATLERGKPICGVRFNKARYVAAQYVLPERVDLHVCLIYSKITLRWGLLSNIAVCCRLTGDSGATSTASDAAPEAISTTSTTPAVDTTAQITSKAAPSTAARRPVVQNGS